MIILYYNLSSLQGYQYLQPMLPYILPTLYFPWIKQPVYKVMSLLVRYYIIVVSYFSIVVGVGVTFQTFHRENEGQYP